MLCIDAGQAVTVFGLVSYQIELSMQMAMNCYINKSTTIWEQSILLHRQCKTLHRKLNICIIIKLLTFSLTFINVLTEENV
jgi:hypothetical protein